MLLLTYLILSLIVIVCASESVKSVWSPAQCSLLTRTGIQLPIDIQLPKSEFWVSPYPFKGNNDQRDRVVTLPSWNPSITVLGMTGQWYLKQGSTSCVAALSCGCRLLLTIADTGSGTDKACTDVLLKGCAMLFWSRNAAAFLPGKGFHTFL